MFRRLRQLKLSLATKCQLLFGIAAGIIILAALFVTWQRIEQLTHQQDIVAAETLAKQRLAEHARTGQTVTGGFDRYDGVAVRRPRLVAADEPAGLSPFEQQALDRFANDDGRLWFRRSARVGGDETSDGLPGLRLVMAARAAQSCLTCHTTDGGFRIPSGQTGPPALEATANELPDPPPLLGLVSVEVPSQVSPRQRLLNRVFLSTAALAAAATATLTLYWILTRLILTPVRVLQETAEKVRGGDLNVRAEIPSGDEFETLAHTLNGMVAGLADRTQKLATANRSLDARLGRLAEANVALDESNRLKGEFLANVSHELRTPLNSILGFADLVKAGAKENEKVLRYAGNIERSGRALLDLINELLDLAKIEAGRMEVRAGELSVKDVFEALVTLVGPLAAKRRVKIVHEVGPSVPILTTDAGKLQQILYNLLSNAIKFSPDGGRIDLVARAEVGPDADAPPTHVRLTVTDQGPGVAPEHQEAIFEKFRQLDSSVTREHTGTGLGLAISRELATLLGGTLGVESKIGEGATFWLRLPVEAPAPRPDKPRAPARAV